MDIGEWMSEQEQEILLHIEDELRSQHMYYFKYNQELSAYSIYNPQGEYIRSTYFQEEARRITQYLNNLLEA